MRESVSRFAAAADRGGLRKMTGGYARARWAEMAELGLVALPVSEELGGMGGAPIDLCLVAEALGKSNAPDPWLENGVIPARLLAASGNAALAGVLSGEAFAALAYAERGQRFSLIPAGTTARRTATGFDLHGEKTFVMGGPLADLLIVSAHCEDGPGWFVVPADRDGLIHHPYRLVDGSIASEIRFNHVALDAQARLPIEPEALDDTVALARLLAAAEMLGLAQRLFDDTLAYVKQREQFGVAIGSFQALQHRLVDCYSALEQARSTIYRAALGDYRSTDEWARAAAGAKAYVGAKADLIAREAVQMHGGMGITDELSIGHAMKRVLLLNRLFGDEEATLTHYAEAA